MLSQASHTRCTTEANLITKATLTIMPFVLWSPGICFVNCIRVCVFFFLFISCVLPGQRTINVLYYVAPCSHTPRMLYVTWSLNRCDMLEKKVEEVSKSRQRKPSFSIALVHTNTNQFYILYYYCYWYWPVWTKGERKRELTWSEIFHGRDGNWEERKDSKRAMVKCNKLYGFKTV